MEVKQPLPSSLLVGWLSNVLWRFWETWGLSVNRTDYVIKRFSFLVLGLVIVAIGMTWLGCARFIDSSDQDHMLILMSEQCSVGINWK